MINESILEALINTRTGKLFILLEETTEGKFLTINPAGEIRNLPVDLFDEDPIEVESAQFKEKFTQSQLDTLREHNESQTALAQRKAAETSHTDHQPDRSPASKPAKKKPRPPAPSKTGLASSWNSSRLTFYRHKIEPLQPKQSFKIVIDGSREFVMTKEDFLSHFNDVVMSTSYRTEGLFSYSEIPEKAKKFLKI